MIASMKEVRRQGIVGVKGNKGMSYPTVWKSADRYGMRPIDLYRIAARGHFKIVQPGGKGEAFVVGEDEWIGAGAPDAKPLVSFGREWFDTARPEAVIAGNFTSSIRDQLAEAVKDLPAPGRGVDRVAVTPTASMRALGRQAAPGLMGEKAAAVEARRKLFTSYADLVAVESLRAAAPAACREIDGKRPPLDTLYRDAATYQAAVNRAADIVAQAEIRTRRAFPGEGPGIQNGREVTYYVTLGDIIGAAATWRASAAKRAF